MAAFGLYINVFSCVWGLLGARCSGVWLRVAWGFHSSGVYCIIPKAEP